MTSGDVLDPTEARFQEACKVWLAGVVTVASWFSALTRKPEIFHVVY